MKTTEKVAQLTLDFNRALQYKKSTFITHNFLDLENILSGIYRDGLIAGYKNLVKINKIEIFLKHEPKGGHIIHKVIKGSTPSLMAIARLNELKTEKKNSPTSISIIRTAKYGIITSDKALVKKSGGLHLGKFI